MKAAELGAGEILLTSMDCDGTKAGYDIVAQAYSGLIYYTGEADGDPMKVGFSVADYMCASNTFAAVIRSLRALPRHRGLLYSRSDPLP